MTERLKYLVTKYYDKSVTPAEKAELIALLQDARNTKELEPVLDELIAADPGDLELPEDVSHKILHNILQPDTSNVAMLPQRRRNRAWMAAAAIAALLGGGMLYWVLNNRTSAPAHGPVAAAPLHDVQPPAGKATLTLGNGQVLVLDSSATPALQGARLGNGAIDYGDMASTGEIVHNVVATPRGGQFKVILPDGSRVWLNAASSLRFPVTFNGPQREVTLIGEGYFEIEPDQQPFIVTAGGMQVKVLGTQFNISAYPEDAGHSATLLQGAVMVESDGQKAVLKPGQQGRISATGHLTVLAADTESALAWKNNRFWFKAAAIDDVMKELTRWYDIDVRYTGAKPEELFTGSIPRQVTLSKALNILAEAGSMQYRIEGKTVTITQ